MNTDDCNVIRITTVTLPSDVNFYRHGDVVVDKDMLKKYLESNDIKVSEGSFLVNNLTDVLSLKFKYYLFDVYFSYLKRLKNVGNS